ncbi:SDR family oxidoreductase [Chryseobacterium ginsenosidimutans]
MKDMKNLLITGASGGIGLETAKLLAEKGYTLTLVARSGDKLEKIKDSLPGNNHSVFVADLSIANDVNKLATHIQDKKYDILINNAGSGLYGKFVDLPLDEQISGMHLNMDAVVMLSYAFLKNAKRGDALVNIASLLGHSSFPGASVYASTKSFVANFSESLWYEFKSKGIFVLGFNPGAAKSEFHSRAGKQTNVYPEFILSSTQDVAKELVAALESRKKPRAVQGWKNRFMLFGFKFISRKMAVNIMGKMSPGMSN